VPIILSDPNTGHDRFNPIKVEKIACGNNHTLFLTRSGLVYQLGRYMHNSLAGEKLRFGNATTPKLVEGLPLEHAVTDIAAGTEHNLVLTEDQKVYAWGSGLAGELGLGIAK
jgi:alpha-tubulin suppressor-like RCC1 family protein